MLRSFASRSRLGAGLVMLSLSTTVAFAATGPDCEEPICDDKKDKFFSMIQKGSKKKPNSSKSTGENSTECPLDRSELGRATWAMLHTTAAYYPEEPSEEQQHAARELVNSLAVLYACSHCREHLAVHVENHPPDVSSRQAFSKWLCETHNAVNEVLGKPLFHCDAEALQKRWRTGCRGSMQ